MKELTFAVPKETEKVVIGLTDKTGEGCWTYLITMKLVDDWMKGSFLVSIFDEDCKTIVSKAIPMNDANVVSLITDVEIGFNGDIETYSIEVHTDSKRNYVHVLSK